MTKKQTTADMANALHDRGLTQLEKGNPAGAVRMFRAAARMGDHNAMHSLGYFYDADAGGRKDRKLAMQWYMRAYRRGRAIPAINIAMTYRDEEDYDYALMWLKRAVALGDISANFEIAVIYMDFVRHC